MAITSYRSALAWDLPNEMPRPHSTRAFTRSASVRTGGVSMRRSPAIVGARRMPRRSVPLWVLAFTGSLAPEPCAGAAQIGRVPGALVARIEPHGVIGEVGCNVEAPE